MDILDAVILGIVQGLTEFLPISSSGHLILAGKLLDVDAVPLAFELLTHLATLLAVTIGLRGRVFALIKKPFQKTTALLVVATVPTVVIFFVFRAFFESALDGRLLIYCFGATAVLLFATEVFCGAAAKGVRHRAGDAEEREKRIGERGKTALSRVPDGSQKAAPTFLDAVIIGIAQGIAGLPGISRSGVTISAGRLLGAGRKASAEFSFLLSIPIILGSCVWELLGGGFDMAGISAPAMLAGFAAAFLTGALSIKFMLKFVANRSMNAFAVYLMLLTAFLIVDKFLLHTGL